MTTTTPPPRLQKGPIPLYVQLADVLRDRLARHHKVGDKIATVDELAREYGLAKVTVRQAQALLEQEGLISRSRGRGVIVLRDQEAPGRIRLHAGIRDLIVSTQGTQTQLLRTVVEAPGSDLVPDFGILAPRYRRMDRIHSIDQRVYAVLTVYLDDRLYTALPEELFARETVVCALATLSPSPIAAAHQRVRVRQATSAEAEALGITQQAPVVSIKRYLSNQAGVLIYLADVTYRADFVHWEMDLDV